MVKTLVLMRHGGARAARPGEDDSERPLTKAGRVALERSLPTTLALLGGRGSVVVWTSPLLRARQTARLVARAAGAPEPVVHGSLASADPERLMAELQEAEGDCVIAVGHVPLVPAVARGLLGTSPDFKPGAMLALEPGGQPSGALALWFVNGPAVEPWEELDALESALAACSRRIAGRRDDFLEEPSASNLHRLRISLREARSLAHFASPWLRGSTSLCDDLSLVQGQTSRLRDMDVLLALVASGSFREAACGDGTPSRLPQVVSLLADEREREAGRLKGALASKRVSAALSSSLKGLGKPRLTKVAREHGVAREELAQRFDRLAGKADALRALPPSTPDELHTLRKREKELRYVIRRLGDQLAPGQASRAASLREAQDALGTACDYASAARLSGELARKGRFSEVRGELERVSSDCSQAGERAFSRALGGAGPADAPSPDGNL